MCLKDIPTILEFPDVFSDDLTGLPLDREVEFAIELILSTAPISMALYRMAPIEFKELKNQLQALLDKAFVHSSASP